MSRLGWWHCVGGASGDMCLGALVGAGVPLETLQAAVDAVGVEPVRLSVRDVERGGLAATKVDVHVLPDPAARSWAQLRALLEQAALADPVRELALRTFGLLAVAEGAVHRSDPEDVHFHEVGGLDAVADVVGTAAGLHALGVTEITASPVALGSGTVRAAHGLLPVPAPAVLALLGTAGAPVHSGPAPYEMCTPTGAALLAATVATWGGLPAMTVTAVGTGAGGREVAEVPNVLRLVVGDPLPAVDGRAADAPGVSGWLVVEANVDDLDPRLWPAVLDRLLAVGAADAWLTPILMKKGRPAHLLAALVPAAYAPAVREVIVSETSSIGLREHRVDKSELDREWVEIPVDGQPVRIKLARRHGILVNASPEFADVAAAAAALHRPVKAVLARAAAAAAERGLIP